MVVAFSSITLKGPMSRNGFLASAFEIAVIVIAEFYCSLHFVIKRFAERIFGFVQMFGVLGFSVKIFFAFCTVYDLEVVPSGFKRAM